MPGGRREGAGRKPGTANKRTREIANEAAANGITPLEVLITSMRLAWQKSEEEEHAGEHIHTAVFWAEGPPPTSTPGSPPSHTPAPLTASSPES